MLSAGPREGTGLLGGIVGLCKVFGIKPGPFGMKPGPLGIKPRPSVGRGAAGLRRGFLCTPVLVVVWVAGTGSKRSTVQALTCLRSSRLYFVIFSTQCVSQLSRLLASETPYALEIVSGLIPFPGY